MKEYKFIPSENIPEIIRGIANYLAEIKKDVDKLDNNSLYNSFINEAYALSKEADYCRTQKDRALLIRDLRILQFKLQSFSEMMNNKMGVTK